MSLVFAERAVRLLHDKVDYQILTDISGDRSKIKSNEPYWQPRSHTTRSEKPDPILHVWKQ